MDFSELLRLTRLFHGLTQKQLAERVNFTQAVISNVENRKKYPSQRLKVALTREFPRTQEFERFLYEIKQGVVGNDIDYDTDNHAD